MDRTHPSGWAGLQYPWVRAELLDCLEELSAPDPRIRWRTEKEQGLVCGIDQVIHFLFDDHDLDSSGVGLVLLDQAEVDAIQPVLRALRSMVDVLPRGGDDDYVDSPLWPAVRSAATTARRAIAAR